MSGGEISGNSSSNYGGGVYMGAGCTFKKVPAPGSSTSGIIYGYTVGDPKSNVVKNSGGAIVPSKGHAVYVSGTKKRETTVTATQSLDSTQDGAAGGWTE
jgi:predicted outer membrane repeat protein